MVSGIIDPNPYYKLNRELISEDGDGFIKIQMSWTYDNGGNSSRYNYVLNIELDPKTSKKVSVHFV
jgi:hypothetical protein